MKKTIITFLLASAAAIGCPAQQQTHRQKAEALLPQLTLDEKISLMMDASPAIPRLGIPQFNWWSEALHGVARAGTATVLPQTIGMAATFDNEAVGNAFEMVSTEARAKFNSFRERGDIKRYEGLAFWTPNVNIFRDPRWGRGQETYGEDPYLAATMGAEVVKGLQGPADGKYLKTLAGAKHFAVHSGPEWNRHVFDAKDIDPRDLWETYLPAFKVLVDSNVQQVMCAYNRYEGEPCCSSKRLLQQILRKEWGYDKIIVSDCWAIRDFISDWAHNTHPSGAHASADAVISGTDLECGPIYKNLRKAYDQGLITEATIDSAVVKLLEARFLIGEIDNAPDVPWNTLTVANDVDNAAHKAIALDMARKSMTLLKNNGILPLKPGRDRILVAGPNAADSVMQWGNYNGFPSHTVTILDGIRSYVPDAAYLRGCDHVVSANTVSRFDCLDGGLSVSYWNDANLGGEPTARAHHTTPLNLSTGGATVFAPDVNLTNFTGLYTGTFVAPEDGDYIIKLEGSKDADVVFKLDGKTAFERHRGVRNNHVVSEMFHARKGERHDISLLYDQGENLATLKFDIVAPVNDALPTDTDADVLIFVGGISPQLEGEEMKVSFPGFRGGDRETIELPSVQRELIRQLKESGKKIVYVNCSGSAIALTPEDSICDAILQAWYPGQAGGTAVAETLFGDNNPAGRLPVTFYRSDAQLPDFEDYSMDGRTYRYFKGTPLYPFGHGLSYTTFSYGTPDASSTTVKTDGEIRVTIPVTNTGGRDGDEVVQLYLINPADPAGPSRTLRAYRRVNVPAGKTSEVTFNLPASTFATYDHTTGRMNVRPGSYILAIGGSSAQTPVEIAVEVTEP